MCPGRTDVRDDAVPPRRTIQARLAPESREDRSTRSSWRGATVSWGRSFGNRRLIARRSLLRHAAVLLCPTAKGVREAQRREGPVGGGPGGSQSLAPGERPPCGLRIGPGNMIGGGAMLAQLTNTLSPFVNRVVLDRTGLERQLRSRPPVDARPPGPRRARGGRFPPRDRRRYAVDLHRGAGAARVEVGVDEGSGGCPRHRPHRAADRGLAGSSSRTGTNWD